MLCFCRRAAAPIACRVRQHFREAERQAQYAFDNFTQKHMYERYLEASKWYMEHAAGSTRCPQNARAATGTRDGQGR